MKDNKLALVTGAAGSMGRAVVKTFIEKDIHVVMVDINEDALNREVKTFPSDRVIPLVLDITDPDAVIESFRKLEENHSPIDILVNNAGILSNNKILETTLSEWNRVLAVNLTGAFLMIQAALPGMRSKKWGRIINISSWSAKCGGVTSGTAYSVSKGGLLTLTSAIARETFRDNITVNAIAPAWVKTPMVTEQLTPEQQKQAVEKIPIGRWCEPEEFANTVSFLASPLAGFITGEVIDMNAGAQMD